MRVAWLGAGLVAVVAAHTEADEAYASALNELRSLVDESISPREKFAASTAGSWADIAAALAERAGFGRFGTPTQDQATLSDRILSWFESGPRPSVDREPHTVYDTPVDALWPDWDYDAVKAERAHARRNQPEILNGWEQAMWGPFVSDLRDEPMPLVQTIAETYRMSEQRSVLTHWLRNQTQRVLPERIVGAEKGPRDTEAVRTAKARRSWAIATLERLAFDDVSAEALIDASFRGTNASAVQADALWVLGEHSLWGTHGAAPNIPRAVRAFERLAALGNATAHARLGFLYGSPLLEVLFDAPVQHERSLMHYVFAAQEGVRGAQLAVGHRYDRGLGVPADCLEAIRWYDAAAQKSYNEFLDGPPGGRTLPYAKLRRSDRAAMRGGTYLGLASGMDNMLLMAKLHRPAVRRMISQEPLALHDAATLHGLLDAYAHHSDTYQLGRLSFLAHALYRGSIVGEGEPLGAIARDYRLAMQYALQVAEVRWPMPAELENYAWTSRRPDGTPQRAYLANEVEKFDQVHTGNAAALLGLMYLRGDGAPQDFVRAKVWLTRAALDGNRRGAAWLAVLLDEGWGGAKDTARAAELFERTQKLGQAPDVALEIAKTLMRSKLPEKALAQLAVAGSLSDVRDTRESSLLETPFELRYLTGSIRADWAYANNRSMHNCHLGLPDLKYAAERADWDDPVYHRAEIAHARGDTATALLAWAVSASQGIEEAQDNIAYILDPVKSYLRPAPPRATDDTALTYWAQSALQGSPHALGKICDYLRLARGTNAVAKDAAACYFSLAESAGNMVSPRWHLAQMYEAGTGSLERDFPLAKRYYDTVAALAPTESALTAFPALVRLHLKALWLWVRGDDSARRLLAAYVWKTQPKSVAPPKKPVKAVQSYDWVDGLMDALVFFGGAMALLLVWMARRYMEMRLQAANAQLAQIQALR